MKVCVYVSSMQSWKTVHDRLCKQSLQLVADCKCWFFSLIFFYFSLSLFFLLVIKNFLIRVVISI